jgi:hypothetical protein
MVLATAKIEDFDRFWKTFSTKGAEKRKQHGCKGSHVFQDPNESDRVWAIFDWDEAGWQSFTSDPEVPAIFQEAGLRKVRPSRRSSSASTTPRPRNRETSRREGEAFCAARWRGAASLLTKELGASGFQRKAPRHACGSYGTVTGVRVCRETGSRAATPQPVTRAPALRCAS